MNCHECKIQITAWLKNYWEQTGLNPPLPADAGSHVHTCPACKNFLAAAQILAGRQKDRITPPPFLSTRINARLAGRIALARGKKGKARAGWLAGLLQYNPGRYLKLSITGLILVILILTFSLALLSTWHTPQVLVQFSLAAPGARQVMVVGDWNNWQPDVHKLRDNDGDGVWELKIKITSGKEYRYQFLIDGNQWVPDPNSIFHVEDGFGGVDSVLQL